MSDSTKHTAGLTNEEKRDAVVTAALDWFSERAIKDWSEAYLAHAIISMEGDHQYELLEVLAEMVVRFQNLRESNGLDRKSNLAKRAYELIAKAAEIAALKGGA